MQFVTKDIDLARWFAYITSQNGPKDSGTRYVLIYLASMVHKSKGATFCRRQSDIANALAMSKRSVVRHINQAVTEGYLDKHPLGAGAGQHWRQNIYTLRWPAK